MTDKEKITAYIDKLLEKYTKNYYLLTVAEFIDSLQEEPVNKDLEEAGKEWLRPQLDKCYANYGEGKMMELTHFDGYAMLDAIEFGAKWQKEQMMSKAIDAVVIVDRIGEATYLCPHTKATGDKAKVIIIKED